MAAKPDRSGHPFASYLYTLHLDGPALAWEYLRRNPDYGRDWDAMQKGADVRGPLHWRLRRFVDPALDARDVHPDWVRDPGDLIMVHPDIGPRVGTTTFRLWAIPGRKHLTHDGLRLLLLVQRGSSILRMALSPLLEEGRPCVCTMQAGGRATRTVRVLDGDRALSAACSLPHAVVAERPDRSRIAHMRSLQALDAVTAGDSQRAIAEAMFGRDHVESRWHPDGELRAQVRYAIRRARTLMLGGYRQLLGPGLGVKGD